MLRTNKWKLEKAKVKVVFRLQFHATNIPQSGWDKLFICLISTESGKIIAKTSKANVRNGTCKWADPIYETTRLLVDSRNKRYDDKLYRLLVGMGTSRASILGEAAINLAEYADASIPLVIALPLHSSDHGTVLHVTVQLLTAKTGFREFEQQFDRGLQSSSNLNREMEPSIAASSSSELQISDDHGNKVHTEKDFRSESKEFISAGEEETIIESFSPVGSNGSENCYADKLDLPIIHEFGDLNGPSCIQSPSTEKANKLNHQGWGSDYLINNDLAIAQEENHRLRGNLEMTESAISELKLELSSVHSYANQMGIETQNVVNHLMAEISSGQKLEREIMVLKSECSKFKDELEQLKEIKSRTKFIEQPPMTQDQANRHQLTWVNGLLLVEDRIRELREKIHIDFHHPNLSFVHTDLDVLLGIVQDLEKVMVQELGFSRGFDLVEGKSLELLSQLNEAKTERGNLIKKMNEMECYYEALVQELEENQKQILGQFQSLRYEHSTCVYTISACKSETEMMRHNMSNELLRFTEERRALGSVNEELTKRVKAAEELVQELEEKREWILKEFHSLRNEHLACTGTISTCKTENELLRRDLNDRTLKFAKERHDLDCINEELKKKVTAAEELVQELEANQERILREFQSLKNEHLVCADTISTCKAETKSVRHEMNDQISRLTEEQNALGRVNKELEKRAMDAEALVLELEENRDRILGEFNSLKNEHSECAATISNYTSETDLISRDTSDKISRFTERHDSDCDHEELEKRVMTAEALARELEESLRSLRNEHSTCADTISMFKAETESIRHDMNDQILKFTDEKRDLICVNEELEKRVTAAETLSQELEEKREVILKEFHCLKNEHSTCVDTISTLKSEAESIRQDVNNQTLKFADERHALVCVNEELEKKREWILGEFHSLKNEHSTCADTISTLKSEAELICQDMDVKILKSTEERHALEYVNKELEKRVTVAEALVKELEENREWILRDFEILTNEHSKCADTISATESKCQHLNTKIMKLSEEKQALGCANEDLEKRVAKTESALKRARSNHLIAVTQLQKDLDTLSFQVSSMFETNQNLIKGTFSESLMPLSENLHEKQLMGCDVHSDDKLQEIFSAKLYLDVYSKTLEETLFGVGINAQQMKQEIDEFTRKLELSNHEISVKVAQINEMQLENQKLEASLESFSKENFLLMEKITDCEALLKDYKFKYDGVVAEKLEVECVLEDFSIMKEELEALKTGFCEVGKSNENIQEDLEIEIIWIVVEAKFYEHYDKFRELTNMLSEQIIKTEEYKNLAEELEKRESEGPSESLRLAFMKEQCETMVQDLKQQLSVSKRHCDDILFKLQDALDEIESRKKSEASSLKKIGDLTFKIVGLEAELQSLQAELECARLNLECCREEREKMASSIQEMELLDGVKKEQFEMSSGSNFQDLQRGLVQLHKANEELRSMYPSFKDFPEDGNALERVLGLELELASALTTKKKSSIQFQSSFLKQLSDEEAILKSFRDINELIKDTLEIKQNYVNMVTELSEMHNRYTELSLQFAEVEGERQKLMMTIKNARSPSNLARIKRSESLDRNLL